MARLASITFLALLSLFAKSGLADDKPPSEQEIKTLVQQLVSPNRAPQIQYDGDARYPAGYDRAAQETVCDAWWKLYQMGDRTFPYLFDHFDDQRYCFTEDEGAGNGNWSIGRACSDIVICHLQPYDNYYHLSHGEGDNPGRPRPSYSKQYDLRTSAGAKLWWEAHKGKSLRELQIETLEWVIAEEAKTPAIYTDGERAYLHEVLTKLQTEKTPLPPCRAWSP